MGKVGSSSIYETLQCHSEALHIHFLHPHRLDSHIRNLKRKGCLHIDKHIKDSLSLREVIESRQDCDLQFVTLLRDPISRNISAFFNNLDNFYRGKSEKQYLSTEFVHSAIDNFFSSYPLKLPDEWVAKEIVEFLGVDLYKNPYPFSKGYQIFREGKYPLLVLRMEDIDRVFITACKDFLNIDLCEMIKTNEGSSKKYKNLYRVFKKTIQGDKRLLPIVSNSRILEHFYIDKKNEILDLWL